MCLARRMPGHFDALKQLTQQAVLRQQKQAPAAPQARSPAPEPAPVREAPFLRIRTNPPVQSKLVAALAEPRGKKLLP